MKTAGCPAWIRTMTEASKGPSATITPPDNSGETYLSLCNVQRDFCEVADDELIVSWRARPWGCARTGSLLLPKRLTIPERASAC
jgi:hypothetical protein